MGSGGGRPLRVADTSAPLRAPLFFNKAARRRTSTLHAQCADATTRTRIFTHWANEASAECASIPAFMALARDLKRASAPTNLVQAALRAAREEAKHTRLCLELANEHATAPLQSAIPAVPHAADTTHEALLERLVLEAFWDGCVAEGSAAAIARRSAILATDDRTRMTLQTIADDEQRHANLAADIVAYGLSIGGRSIRNALADSLERRSALHDDNDVDEPAIDEDVARAHGLPGRKTTYAARVENWEKSNSMLDL